MIQKMVPQSVQVDDSGITTEPVRITLDVQGQPGDLKNGQVIYSEDGVEKKAVPVGDLHAGVQTVTIPPGFHTTSSSEMFSFTVIRPDGSETPDISLFLNSPNSVPPPEPPHPAPAPATDEPDSDQPIATIAPGVDRDELESIQGFDSAAAVDIVSFDGFARETSGDESKLPPQVFTLHGTNFKDGMLVEFSTIKGGQPVKATSPLMHTKVIGTLSKPSSYKPSNPSELMSATVVVPAAITHDAQGQFSVRAADAFSTDSCP
ncbi:MAG: hypothetical protein WA434_12790 [Candidatus Acidiferrales bacterium]